MTDRTAGIAEVRRGVDVRRLMYQSLIWVEQTLGGRDPRRFRTSVDTKNVKRLANALVDRVGRYSQFDRDFLGRQVLEHERKAFELTGCQPFEAIIALHRFADAQSIHGSCNRHLPFSKPISQAEYFADSENSFIGITTQSRKSVPQFGENFVRIGVIEPRTLG